MAAYEKIMEAGLLMLSRKKMTILQAHQRLLKIFPNDDAEIRRVLQRLQEMNYLNDLSYAQAYARDRMRFRPRGISLIKMELQKKGLSKDLIEEVLSQIVPTSSVSYQENFSTNYSSDSTHEFLDEFSAAQKLARSYMKKTSFCRAKDQRGQLMRFLTGKGFGGKIIFSIVSAIFSENENL